MRRTAEQHVVAHRHVGRQLGLLRHVGHQPGKPPPVHPGDLLPADRDVAAVACQARDRPQQGGLARAIRADQAEPFAVRYLLGDAVKGGQLPVADTHRIEADHDRSRRVRRDRSTKRKNGAPAAAVITPIGTSAGACTVRAATSARTRNAAPPIIDTGSTTR